MKKADSSCVGEGLSGPEIGRMPTVYWEHHLSLSCCLSYRDGLAHLVLQTSFALLRTMKVVSNKDMKKSGETLF